MALYCQAQPKLQVKLSLKAELALFSINPATHHQPPTPTHPPTRNISEIAGNEQNLLSNIGRSTLVELKTLLKNMEDDLTF